MSRARPASEPEPSGRPMTTMSPEPPMPVQLLVPPDMMDFSCAVVISSTAAAGADVEYQGVFGDRAVSNPSGSSSGSVGQDKPGLSESSAAQASPVLPNSRKSEASAWSRPA